MRRLCLLRDGVIRVRFYVTRKNMVVISCNLGPESFWVDKRHYWKATIKYSLLLILRMHCQTLYEYMPTHFRSYIQDDVLVKIQFNGFHSNIFKMKFKTGWCRTEGPKRFYGGLGVMAWYRSMSYAFKVQTDVTFVFCEVNILAAKYHICQHKKPKHLETCRFEWFISKIYFYHFGGDYCWGWCVFEKDNY